MKKIISKILIALLLIFPICVEAEGYISASPTSLSIEEGSSKTFTITAYNAIGDVTISSSNASVATVSSSSWETGVVGEKETRSVTITVKGISEGSATIRVNIDGATFDKEDLSGQTKTINVTVNKKKEEPKPQPVIPSNPNNNNNNNNNNNTNSNANNNLSKNNKLKTISVEGYKLSKVNDNYYTLTVQRHIEKVNIKATAEDNKAKLTGIGTKTLKTGDNNIEIVITSESGAKNVIKIKITRKDEYYQEDLEEALKQNLETIDIIIKDDSVITKEELQKIKESKKVVNFVNKEKKYTWIIDGNKTNASHDISTNITYTTELNEEIKKLSNYAEGIGIIFKHQGELPTGVKIKLYVKDKYEDGKIVNIYNYNKEENKLENVKKDLVVTNGYVELETAYCSEYFVTMAKIQEINETKKEESSKVDTFMVVSIIELIIIIALIILYVIKLKCNKKQIV